MLINKTFLDSSRLVSINARSSHNVSETSSKDPITSNNLKKLSVLSAPKGHTSIAERPEMPTT